MIFRSSSQAMGTINSGELIRSHQRLREDLVLSAYAAYLAELTNRIIEEGEPVPIFLPSWQQPSKRWRKARMLRYHTCVRDEYVGGSRLYATAPRVRLMRAEDEPMIPSKRRVGRNICDRAANLTRKPCRSRAVH